MDVKYARLFKNSFIIMIGSAGSRILGLIMLPFYTHWLNSSNYGTTDIINVYSTFLLSIISFCLAEAIFVFPKNKDFGDQKKYFSSALFYAIFSFIFCGICFYFLSLYFHSYHINNSFSDNLWYIFAMMIVTFLQQYIQQFICSIDKMFIYSSTGIILSILTIFFSFILIPNYGVYGYICSIIYANIIASIYSLLFSRAYSYLSWKSVKLDKIKEMLKYSIPLIPNSLMWWLVSSINRPIIEAYIGLSAIGIFAVSNKFPSIITMLFQVFAVSWQVSVLEEFGKKDYKSFYNRILKLITLLLVLLSIGLAIFSKEIIRCFTSNEFIDASKYLPILALGVVFSCISSFVGCNFSAAKESKYFFYSSLWGALASIASNLILIPIMGLWGAAFSVLISFIVMTISRIISSWKYVHIGDYLYYVQLLILNCIIIGISFFMKNTLSSKFISISLLLFYCYTYKSYVFVLIEKLSKRNNK
jgi:O-antigen/teichoic acid export membrane protein